MNQQFVIINWHYNVEHNEYNKIQMHFPNNFTTSSKNGNNNSNNNNNK